MELGRLIKEARKAKGMTQQELGDIAGYTGKIKGVETYA